MAEGNAQQWASMTLTNIPVKVPTAESFAAIGCDVDLYNDFLSQVEVITQQMVQKYMVQLMDAATEGAGLVPETVIKAAVSVDKALNRFVEVQHEQAQRDSQRRKKPTNGKRKRKRNRNRRRSKKRR